MSKYFWYELTEDEERELEESMKLHDPFEVESRNEVDGIRQTSNARKAFLAKVRNRYAEEIKDDPEKLLDEIRALCMSRADFSRMQKARKAINDLAKAYGEPETTGDLGQGEKSYIAHVTKDSEAFLYWLDKLGMKAAGEQIIKEAARKAYEKKRPQPPKGLMNYGQSPIIHMLIEAMSNAANLDLWVNRSQRSKTTLQKAGTGYAITRSTTYSEMAIELWNLEKMDYNSVRFVVLLLSKINERAMTAKSDGAITDVIYMTYNEIAETMGYSNPDHARRAIKNVKDPLTSIKIQGTFKVYKKGSAPRVTGDRLTVLFDDIDTGKRGGVYIGINPRINWRNVLQYFTIMPNYYYSLSRNAAIILEEIFYQARQNMTRNGVLRIRLDRFQTLLGLPAAYNNPKPSETIRTPIEKALNEIMTAHQKEFPADTMGLEVIAPDGSVADWLSKGYTEIKLAGALRKTINASKKRALQEPEEG